jgi:hypothetical protein
MTTKWILAGALVLAVTAANAKAPKKVKPAPKAAAAQFFCNPQGCRPVAPGCHIEVKNYMGMSGNMNVEVCN